MKCQVCEKKVDKPVELKNRINRIELKTCSECAGHIETHHGQFWSRKKHCSNCAYFGGNRSEFVRENFGNNPCTLRGHLKNAEMCLDYIKED